VAAVDTDY